MTTPAYYKPNERPQGTNGEVRQCMNCRAWFSWYSNECPACEHNATVPKSQMTIQEEILALKLRVKKLEQTIEQWTGE